MGAFGMICDRRRAFALGLCFVVISVPFFRRLRVCKDRRPRAEEAAGRENAIISSAVNPGGHRNSTPPLFSKEWEENYGSGHVGCDFGRKRYYWRPCGFGSNIVHLLNAFVYAIAVHDWSDVAVMSPPGALDALECTGEFGISVQGYYCLFKPMPHVCNFGREKEWLEFMRSKKVPQADIKAAPKLHWQMVRSRATWAEQDAALAEHGVDTFGALAVMARYFWKNLSPWLEEDVRKTLDRPDVEIFRSEPYVGFHIRRGDKVSEGEAAKVETRKYLEAALKFYQDRTARGAEEIKAVWVASDDKEAAKEVRVIVRDYFPNVANDDVVWISGVDGEEVATRSTSEAYEGFVTVFADLQMLSAANVFVGTYSSNVGRLVALLREGVDGHGRESCISLDRTRFGLEY